MNQSRPAILPEDTAPPAHRSCRKCELSRHSSRIIWGEGNPAAPLFVVLDNPGAREDKDGFPFLCGTRETMQTAAFAAGLKPGSIYVSYILKCRPRKAYDKETAREACIAYLWEQLAIVSPVAVICLGDVVCRSFFGNPGLSVKQLRGKVQTVRGYHVIASYHPLAVRRRPVLYRLFLQDWQLAAETMHRLLADR